MSNLGSTSSAEDEVIRASSNETESSLERKVGIAKQFDKEMKDYAKATVKEFLGIYGYEEDVDINIDDSGGSPRTDTTSMTKTDPHTETTSSMSNQQSSQSQRDSVSSTAAAMKTRECVEGATNEHAVTSVSISSSTTNGNADLTRFCITMSIPRNGADSEQGYTTLRFWNCIMCSTAFVGCTPEIVQRIHYPHLFTYQPEWLSHAGICTRCQNALTMRAPKITIYAINEEPQYHHSYPAPPAPVPTVGGMCNALPGQCNCAAGIHVPGVVPMVYTGATPRSSSLCSNVPVANTKPEAVPACNEAGFTSHVTHGAKKTNYAFRPITCTQ